MQQRSANPKLAAIVGVLALLLALTMTPAGAATSTSPMFDFANEKEVKGSSSTLMRNLDMDKIMLEVETTTRPGAYTIWWIIFNNPAMCSDPGCGEDDVFNEDGTLNIEQIQKTQLSALWATGGVVGKDRVGEFSAMLKEGEVPGQLLLGENVGSVNGLTDAAGAEVHPILRWHGPASKDPDMLDKQLTTVDGGCRGQKLLRSGNPSGDPGEGPCRDLQFAVHK